MTSQNFSRAEKDAINCNTVTQFRKYWEDTSISRDAFENNHQKGCGLWVKRYPKTAVLVQEFMEDFNPIVEFVTMFAAPYGGIAVGTISVLFAVRFWNHDKK